MSAKRKRNSGKLSQPAPRIPKQAEETRVRRFERELGDLFRLWKRKPLLFYLVVVVLLICGAKFVFEIFRKTNSGPTLVTTSGAGSQTTQIIGNNNVVIIRNGDHDPRDAASEVEARKTLEQLNTDRQSANAESNRFTRGFVETKPLPGLSCTIYASFERLSGIERKYVFDTGSCSLFFDSENALRFMATDIAGEQQSVRLEQGPGGFVFDNFILLTCEAASSRNESFLRILVNGEEKARTTMNHALPFKPWQTESLVVGADVQGKNGAGLKLITFLPRNHTLTKDQAKVFVRELFGDENKGWIEFNGKQWWRADQKGNLVQRTPGLLPTIWVSGKRVGYVSVFYNQFANESRR